MTHPFQLAPDSVIRRRASSPCFCWRCHCGRPGRFRNHQRNRDESSSDAIVPGASVRLTQISTGFTQGTPLRMRAARLLPKRPARRRIKRVSCSPGFQKLWRGKSIEISPRPSDCPSADRALQVGAASGVGTVLSRGAVVGRSGEAVGPLSKLAR